MKHPPCESCAAKAKTPERSLTMSPELHITRARSEGWPDAYRQLVQYAEAAEWVAHHERTAPAYMVCCHANAPGSERAAKLYRAAAEAARPVKNPPEL